MEPHNSARQAAKFDQLDPKLQMHKRLYSGKLGY